MSFNARTAFINLSNGAITTEVIADDKRSRLLGGRGFNIEQISRISGGTEALSPENVVAVGIGLLAGMLAPGACRTSIVSRSPLTGYLANADLGGFFAPELRRAGFDQLVLTGKAKKPVLVLVHDGKVTLQNASFVWGQDIPETQEILRKHFEDDDIQTLCIGPAGENVVRFATVSTRHHGTNRQGGIGAVFGSKNLKAIVAKGQKNISVAHPKEALAYDMQMARKIASSGFAKNLQCGVFSNAQSGEDLFREQIVGPEGCYGCQIPCERRFAIRRGPHAGVYGYVPGRLLSSAWKEVMGSQDANAILFIHYLVNSLGLDSLETAGLMSWAIELSSRGILTDEEMGGLDIASGNIDAVSRLIAMIASREGLGGVLAEGAAGAADKLGRGSALFLRETRGMTNVLFDQLRTPWQALGTATSLSLSDHSRFQPLTDPGRLQPEVLAKILNPMPNVGLVSSDPTDRSMVPALVFWTEICGMSLDMLGMCDFQSVLFDPDFPGFEEFSRLLALNADLEMTAREIWDKAERASNMERVLNLRLGYNPVREKLANWYSGTPGLSGESLDEAEYDRALTRYYSLRGWDSTGIPTPATLKRHGLESLMGKQSA